MPALPRPMFLPLASALWSLCLAVCACAAQAAPAPAADRMAPRAVAEAVADAVQARFYDAGRADEIARTLRRDAAAGAFDARTEPAALATALSARLQPFDGHLRVSWRPGDAPDGATAAPARRVPPPPLRGHGVRSVQSLPGNLGYLDLRGFPDFDPAAPQSPARQALDAALQLLAGADAVIVDLRDNGGGSPDSAGYLISAFVPAGRDVYNRFAWREGAHTRHHHEAPREPYAAPRPQVPLYLLTSARTGSAAESFAYTLKHAGRAVVVGETSAGAANPGQEFPVGAGFSVFVATGSPTNPMTQGNWEGVGVAPDVAVAPAQALATAQALALETLLRGDGLDRLARTQAQWALDALRAAPTASAPDTAAYVGRYERLEVFAQAGRLLLRDGRRPPLALARLGAELGPDLFCLADEPSLRLRFLRDDQGRVTALETAQADGGRQRYSR